MSELAVPEEAPAPVPALAYQRSGHPSPVPLVLLHALPLDSSMWDGVRSKLPHIDIITPDAPGFGASSAILIERIPSLSLYAQALKALLDQQGISRIVLGGLSMGGAVAAEFTALYPQMVAGLALLDTNIGADTESQREGRLTKATLADQGQGYSAVREWPQTMLSPQAPDAIRQEIDSLLRHLPDKGMAWQQRAMANRHDNTHSLAVVNGPVFLGRGDADPTCSLEYLMSLAQQARHPHIREFSCAGHFAANEQPAQVAEFLGEFYEKSTSATISSAR